MEAVAAPPVPFDPLVLAGMMITVAVAIFLPLIAAARFLRATGAPSRVLVQGALVFVVAQIVVRLPLLTGVQYLLGDRLQDPVWMLPWVAFGAVTAALFEELGRYLGYRKLVQERSWRTGVTFGLGHGGIEAIIFGGLFVMGSAVGYVMVTRGGTELTPEQQQAFRQIFGDATGGKALIAAVERVGALVLQVALSLLVLRAYLSGKKWLWLAIGVHTAVNLVVPVVAQRLSIYAAEAVMVAIALGGFLWIRRAKPFIEAGQSHPPAAATVG